MSLTVQQAMMNGTDWLKASGVEEPARDAKRLMAAFLKIEPDRLTLHLHDTLDDNDEGRFYDVVLERMARKPLSHLVGYRDFYKSRFIVSAEVLDPRPDKEALVRAAMSEPFSDVLDLGTGTGCILISLLAERNQATGIGTDISPTALEIAGMNAVALGVAPRCDFLQSNWYEFVGGQFDLIVSNPPYIAADEMAGLAPELSYEPRIALTDEGDGLSAYRTITAGAGAHLKPGGRLMVEIGLTQGKMVSDMFMQAGFQEISVLPDLDGRDRVVSGRWP